MSVCPSISLPAYVCRQSGMYVITVFSLQKWSVVLFHHSKQPVLDSNLNVCGGGYIMKTMFPGHYGTHVETWVLLPPHSVLFIHIEMCSYTIKHRYQSLKSRWELHSVNSGKCSFITVRGLKLEFEWSYGFASTSARRSAWAINTWNIRAMRLHKLIQSSSYKI